MNYTEMSAWYELSEADSVLTPQVLFYPDRIAENIQQMLRIAGSPERLRPHVKTYKCQEVVRMQLEADICAFKCATLAEASLLGESGAPDVLIAYPLVGPTQTRFLELTRQYPKTRFSALIDHESQLDDWNQLGQAVDLFIDLNVGMNRTGIPSEKAAGLFEQVQASKHRFGG